jgi:tetratricopeptide (TPR) repeat protein
MGKNYCSYPADDISNGLRTVFLYAAPEDVGKLPALAERIAHPKSGTKCRVKWLKPASPVDEADLKNELTLSQVLIVYVTKSLVSYINKRITKRGLPLPIQFMRDNHKPYFPIADVAENLEIYCKLDRPIHGLMESDIDFDNKLKEQLSKYVLDEKTLKEIREKGIINQIFLSYRKDDVLAAQDLMREIHNFKGFDAISIWYDRFLNAGNLFDKEILDALDQSKAFTMVISPTITAKREDGSDNYVVKHEYPRAHEKKKPIVPIYLPDYSCEHDDLKSVFKDIPELLAIEQTEPYLRSVFPDLPSVDTYSSERLYLLGRAYLSGFYFEQDSKRAVSLFQRAAGYEDGYGLKSAEMLAKLYESGDQVGGINYDEELKWRLRCVELSEKIYGKEHSKTIDSYNNTGGAYYNKGNHNKALEYYNKTVEVCEKVLGKDHRNMATYYNNIGLVYDKKGNYNKALEYYLKALEIDERIYEKNHSIIDVLYNNIALSYNNKGSYEKALEYYLKSLAIREKVLGKEHPDTAMSYNNIGLVYNNKGDCEKALEYYFKALKIQEKVLGKDHPDTAISYNNVGLAYRKEGDYKKALKYYFKALEINEKIFGKEHPDTAFNYNNIGSAYYYDGNLDKGLEYSIKALEIREKFLGKDHPNTGTSYNNIAMIYFDKGDNDKALVNYLKGLEIDEKLLGKDHPNIASSYNNIGMIYYNNCDYEKALEFLNKAVSIYIRFLGKEHQYVKAISENINDVNILIKKQKSKPGYWLKRLFKKSK